MRTVGTETAERSPVPSTRLGAPRLLLAALAAVAMLVAALAVGAPEIDPAIANQWGGYHYGSEANRVAQINLGAKHGTTMIVHTAKASRELVRLEDHQANWYFDDVGYLLFGQFYTMAFGEITASDLARIHNVLFLVGLTGFVAAATLLSGNLVAGLLLIPVSLALHRLFAGFAYNSVSNHSLIVPAVACFIPCLMLAAGSLRARRRAASWTVIATTLLASGMVAGAMALFRSPVGTGAILSLAVVAVLAAGRWRDRGMALALCLAGYVLMTNVVPGVAAIHRDHTLGWTAAGNYFSGPPKHVPNFTLVAMIGRYENSLGLKIVDRAVDDLLVARKQANPQRYPLDYDVEFERIARDVLIDYATTHPGEFLRHRLRGLLELPAVIPAVTFQSRDNFTGSPWTTPAIEPIVEEWDRRPEVPSQLINVRVAYIDIAIGQWAAYLAAVAAFIGGLVLSWRRRASRDPAIIALWGLVALTGLYGAVRALVPWWGQDFVLVFWMTAAYAGVLVGSDVMRRVCASGAKRWIWR